MPIEHITASAPTIDELLAREDIAADHSPCYGYVEHCDGQYEWTMSHPPEAFVPKDSLGLGFGEYFYAMMRRTNFSDFPLDAAAGIAGWMWISQGWATVHETEAELENARPSKDPTRRHVDISLYLDHHTGALHHRFAIEGDEPVIEVLPYPTEGWKFSRGAVLAGMDHTRLEILKLLPGPSGHDDPGATVLFLPDTPRH
jgi:hypothetical protein